jgi:hypothetical protein
MAIAKQFDFFIYGRGLLTNPALPLSQANITYSLDVFHVNGNAFNLTLLSSGLQTALKAAVGACIVQAATIPSTATGTGPLVSKQFEYQFDGRGVLTNPALPFDSANISYVADILSINGVAYKLSTFTTPQLTALSTAVGNAIAATNTIPALVATNLTATVTTNNSRVGTNDVVTATVTDQNGNPVSGVVVTFANAGTGTASGTSVAATATTNGSGIGTSNVGATGAGTVIGTATMPGFATPATWTATIVPANSVVTAAVVAAGGTGYAVNDTINLANGVVLNVLTLSTTAVATVSVTTAGSVATASKPTGAQAQVSTSGAGTGATFTLTWNP